MSRARSLSPEESARVAAAVRLLMEEYGSQMAVSKQLQMPDGSSVSQASVSLSLRGIPVGVTFARAVALKLGMSFEELVSGASAKADGVRRYKQLPGWAEAAAEVAAEELLPGYVVAAAGENLVSFPVKRVDAGFVYDQGMLWLKHAPLDVRKGAEKADILAGRAERDAREEKRYSGLLQSDALARVSRVAEVPAVADHVERQR
jgi:hypothetical protein